MKNKTFIQFATALIIICATQTAKGLAIPTSKGDTDEYYEALGIANGPKARMGELHMLSLKNAQDIIRQKMAHTYKGVIEDYIRVYGNNRGTDIDTKMERIGKQFINVFLNDTREIGSPEFTEADQDGNVTCYVLARVYKRGLPDKMADYISGSHELEGEIEGKALREIIKQHFENQRVSDVYPFSPRVFIPGMQQRQPSEVSWHARICVPPALPNSTEHMIPPPNGNTSMMPTEGRICATDSLRGQQSSTFGTSSTGVLPKGKSVLGPQR